MAVQLVQSEISYAAGVDTTLEQDVFEITIPRGALRISSLLFDMEKATTGFDAVHNPGDTATFRIYVKVDGTNYRQIGGTVVYTQADGENPVLPAERNEWVVGGDLKVTVQISADRGAYDLPFTYVTHPENDDAIIIDTIESHRGHHTVQGDIYYVDPVNGDTHANGARGTKDNPYDSVQDCHDNAVTDNNHDLIILVAGNSGGVTTLTEDVTISKRYLQIRGPGRDLIWTRTGAGNTIAITSDGVGVSGVRVQTAGTGSGDGINVSGADFCRFERVWVVNPQGHGIQLVNCTNCEIDDVFVIGAGQGGTGSGVVFDANGNTNLHNSIRNGHFHGSADDGILLTDTAGGGALNSTAVQNNESHDNGGYGINIAAATVNGSFVSRNIGHSNTSGHINDSGTNSQIENNEQWAQAGATKVTLDDLNDPTAADNADAVWDEDIVAAHGTADTAGLLVRALGAAISQRTNNPTLNALLAVPDAAGEDIRNSIWDAAIAGYLTAGSTGEALNDASAASAAPTAAAIADAVWDEDIVAAHGTADTAGLLVRALGAAISQRTNNPTLHALLNVPDTSGTTLADPIADGVWDEDIVAAHGGSDTAGLLLRALGADISQRSNAATLHDLLSVPDTAGRNISYAFWDEVLDVGVYSTADSGAERLRTLDDIAQAGGVGDLQAVKTQVDKIDQAATAGSPATGSIADDLDSLTTLVGSVNTEYVISVNIDGTRLHIEVALEQFGVILLTPTQAQAQIIDESGSIIHNIGIGDFGAIGARGFFTHDIDPHNLVSGETYQMLLTIDATQTTKVFRYVGTT